MGAEYVCTMFVVYQHLLRQIFEKEFHNVTALNDVVEVALENYL